MANRNLELLIGVARLLRPLLDDLVFVGGCTTALLITDAAAAEVRPTYDVDSIAENHLVCRIRRVLRATATFGFCGRSKRGSANLPLGTRRNALGRYAH